MTDTTFDDTLDLLDATLDDLADMPSNEAFPAGAHHCVMTLSLPKPKQGEKPKPMVVIKFKYKAPLELADPTSVAPSEADEYTMFANLKKKDGTPNTYGQGLVKMCCEALRAGGIEGASTRDFITNTSAGVEVAIVTGLQKSEQYGTQMTLQKISML